MIRRLYILCIIAGLLFPTVRAQGQNDTAFTYTYGGYGEDHGRSITKTNDGGYLIAGSSSSHTGSSEIYLVKIDSMCNYTWSKTIGINNVEWAEKIISTYDNGYALTGYSNSYGNKGYQAFIVKLDSLGTTQWKKFYGGTDWDFGNDIIQLPDSGFAVAGYSYSNNQQSDVYIFRTDKSGDTLWTKYSGGTGDDRGNSLILTSGNNLLVTGETETNTDSTDLFLEKLNLNGQSIWIKTHGGPDFETGHQLIEANAVDSGFVMIGATSSFYSTSSDLDIYLLKTDHDGNFKWAKSYGHSTSVTNQDDEGNSVQELPNGNLLIGGYTKTVSSGKKDASGFIVNFQGNWIFMSASFGGLEDDYFNEVIRGQKGEYLFLGSTYTYGIAYHDVYLVKTDTLHSGLAGQVTVYEDTAAMVNVRQNDEKNEITVTASPNPFTTETHFKFKNVTEDILFEIYHLTGQKVHTHYIPPSSGRHTVHTESFPSGLYLYKVSIGNKLIKTGKIIKK